MTSIGFRLFFFLFFFISAPQTQLRFFSRVNSQNKINKNAKKRKIDQVQDEARQSERIKRLKKPMERIIIKIYFHENGQQMVKKLQLTQANTFVVFEAHISIKK